MNRLPYRLRAEAVDELDAAAAFYESRRAGLGTELAAEALTTVELATVLRSAGHAEPGIAPSARRILLRHFPYAMVYVVDDDGVLVLAFARVPVTRREPR